MKDKQNKIIIESLLDDDLFVEWILRPTSKLDDYWLQEIAKNPTLEKYISVAKESIKHLHIDEPTLSFGESDKLWNAIENKIESKEKQSLSLRKLFFYISSTAAVLAILLGGYWYISSQDAIDYYAILAEAPSELDSQKINLVTSDSHSLVIDEDAVALEYDDKGELSINSKKIAPTKTNNEKTKINQLFVPYGKIASMVLSDGTKIWVNSGSKLLYPDVFGKDKREIFVSGEVFLDVTKAEDYPFYIKTDKMDVRVLGTELNVSAYPNDLQQSVVLVSGSVKVKGNRKFQFNNIKPNQKFEYEVDSGIANICEVDVENYMSWIHGYLLLESEPLSKVLERLGRHYNFSFEYSQQDFQEIKISGKLELQNNLEDLLTYISVIIPIHYEVKGNTVAVFAN